MVVLVALGLSLGILLVVTMVSMTRYLRANPDDPLVPYEGTWSGALGQGAPASRTGSPTVPEPPAREPVTVASSPRPASSYVPLDDMPAEVIAEAARRLRRG